jgi:PAS domain S-box-containing protein
MMKYVNEDLWQDLPTRVENNFLSTLIDSIPALVGYIDCNMILQFCNQPFRAWFSLDGDSAGKAFPVIVGAQIFNQLQRHMGKVLMGERAHFQVSVYTANDLQFLDATLSPDFDDRKKVKGFIFHALDVTEKYRTERALKDYFENASIGLHWVNSDGIIIWANPAELQMLGYTEDEYIGHHISEFHAHKGAIKDILNRLSTGQVLTNYEAELLQKDGATRHVAINSSVLWEGDKFVHTRCFTIDITEEKLAAKALSASEQKFRMIANLVPLILWTFDEHGDCNFLSVRWKEFTGKDVEDGLGRGWNNFLHPNDKENVMRSWQRSASERKPFEAKFRLRNAEGGYTSYYTNSLPRYDAGGNFEGHIGILQNISTEEQIRASLEKIVLDKTDDLRKKNTELRIAEKALLQQNEQLENINNQLSSFAHVASHDLQEPLRKIQILSSQLFDIEGNKFSEKGKQLYYRIGSCSSRMRDLINDLLNFSTSSNDEGQFENVDLNSMIQEIISDLEVKITDKNAVIEIEELPRIRAIKFQFHQLFLNLLNNALKFSRVGIQPLIVIKSAIVDDSDLPDHRNKQGRAFYHITVADNGIGFDPKSSKKIFEMFHRLHGRSEYEGTGIGLAICKKIVENHEGLIVAKGRPGFGSTFHIYLPITGVNHN